MKLFKFYMLLLILLLCYWLLLLLLYYFLLCLHFVHLWCVQKIIVAICFVVDWKLEKQHTTCWNECINTLAFMVLLSQLPSCSCDILLEKKINYNEKPVFERECFRTVNKKARVQIRKIQIVSGISFIRDKTLVQKIYLVTDL